jgi:hypothetical protein
MQPLCTLWFIVCMVCEKCMDSTDQFQIRTHITLTNKRTILYLVMLYNTVTVN